MISKNENEPENEKKRVHRYDINRPRSRHRDKYAKYKMCLAKILVICIRQHLSNFRSTIYEKIKALPIKKCVL